jgi:hypothetical protein
MCLVRNKSSVNALVSMYVPVTIFSMVLLTTKSNCNEG